MGFITFNEKYYLGRLSEFEGRELNKADLYEVKQILKILDDLADEGYTELNNDLEEKFHVITRLKRILSLHSEKPFLIEHISVPAVCYGNEEFEISKLCDSLILSADSERSDNPFLDEINAYCSWITYEKDTAYVFLFRDALLPYVFFRNKERANINPWLISRAFLYDISGTENVDDDIRLPIYEALEYGISEFSQFKEYYKERICGFLAEHEKLKRVLKELLCGIREERIIVVESGYCGTVPMLLAALDERVDFRLYTTAPFLYDTYRDKIFCRRYENIRLFETLLSQDILTQYSSFRDGKFYVKVAEDNYIKNKAFGEINRVIME